MFQIITDVATFGNWRDCYLYMKEEGMQSINVIKTRYCLQDIFGKHNYTIREIGQMAQVVPFNEY